MTVHCWGNACCTLHLIHVILHSPPHRREELIAVLSLSFSISPALSCPLWVKHMCGVTVNPPRPIYSSTHHIQAPCALSASQLLPSSLYAHSLIQQLWTLEFSSPPVSIPQPQFHFPIPSLLPILWLPLLPSSFTWGYMITHFGGNRFPPEQPKLWAYSLHQNSTLAKLLSHRVCHVNVAVSNTGLSLKYCNRGAWCVSFQVGA